MTTKSKTGEEPWIDPDDAPPFTEEMFRAAAMYRDGKPFRPATGKLGPNGVVPLEPGERGVGRPPLPNPKKQVTLRLDPDVLAKFRATGRGWQSRINEALRKALEI